MSYNSSQYYQMEEEEEEKKKGKTIKIPKKGISDYDAETRYISRKGHREAMEKHNKEIAEETEGYTEPRKRKEIKVSQYTPDAIISNKLKIRTNNPKERYERRKGKNQNSEVEPVPTYDKDIVVENRMYV